MIEGVTKFTAQQLDYKRTTAVVRLAKATIPTTDINDSDNFYCLFRQLSKLLSMLVHT